MRIFFTNEWKMEREREKILYSYIAHWFGCTTCLVLPEKFLEIHLHILNFGIHIICREEKP